MKHKKNLRKYLLYAIGLIVVSIAFAQTDVSKELISTCDEMTVFWNTTTAHYEHDDVCAFNETTKKDFCWTVPRRVYKTTQHNKTICRPMTKRIEYEYDKLEFEKLFRECTVYSSYIICDDTNHGDGNGDGICQAGETCYKYLLTDKIDLVRVENGQIDITTKYKEEHTAEIKQ